VGTPKYPDDWASQWKELHTAIQQATTAARVRVTPSLIIGDPAGARIELHADTQTIVISTLTITGRLYVNSAGALHWQGPSTDTQIAPA
jgi:hypothetical protein